MEIPVFIVVYIGLRENIMKNAKYDLKTMQTNTHEALK